jgi:tRNA threonylcarbamoyl adenosine modification protein YeaZ
MSAATQILAFDTSGPWCGAALLIDGRIVAQRHEEMPRGQAERLMPMLDEVMAEGGLGWDDLDVIAVGTGPGNFTGIRVGVAAARGLALGLQRPAIGVSAFEALRGHIAAKPRLPREVITLPSRNGTFVQLFEDGLPSGDPLEHPANASSLDAFGHLRGLPFFGPHAARFADIAGAARGYDYADFGDTTERRIATRIGWVAARKLARGLELARPAPLYIRPPDAAPPSDPPPVILP